MEPLENWGKYLMDPLGFGGDKEKPRRAGRGEKRREEEGRTGGLTIVEEDIGGGLEECLC